MRWYSVLAIYLALGALMELVALRWFDPMGSSRIAYTRFGPGWSGAIFVLAALFWWPLFVLRAVGLLVRLVVAEKAVEPVPEVPEPQASKPVKLPMVGNSRRDVN